MQLILIGDKYFLATRECTKHPKITTVAVQGLDNTCADHSGCRVNKRDLQDLLQGPQTTTTQESEVVNEFKKQLESFSTPHLVWSNQTRGTGNDCLAL